MNIHTSIIKKKPVFQRAVISENNVPIRTRTIKNRSQRLKKGLKNHSTLPVKEKTKRRTGER